MGGLVSRWKTSNSQSPSNEEVREEDPVLTHSLGFAWVTLATNDSYSLGALVLAHSLKNVNTAHKLAVLITPTVSASMREQLSTVFDVVKVVDVLDSKDEAHLALLKRPELGITFTKIHCWRLTEFDKCVFLDADTLVIRNCDELFDREELSAAPDVGWPDCFNTGVFVYKPSVETFNNLIQFSLQHGSFDGGDQGLLNQFFSDWATKDIQKHLPFVYNLTSVAVYSYMPAFKQYGSQIRIVHFIGTGKPWQQPVDPSTRAVNPAPGSEHLTPMLQIWWDIFCEKVHPSLAKNLDCGTNNDEIEACSNDVPVERETAEITLSITPYIEKDDSRQFNLPYHPFDVKSSSGELLNITYCEKREQEEQKEVDDHYHDPEPKEQLTKEAQLEPEQDREPEFSSGSEEVVIANIDNQVPIKSYEEVVPTVDTYTDEGDGEEAEETATEDKQYEQSPFTYDTFFPDETCVQNYLEHNVKTYHPFDNSCPESVVEPDLEYTLPRFLTIAEDDVRQSLNVCHEDPQPKPQLECQSQSPPSKIVQRPLENYDDRSISRSMSEENLSKQCDEGNLLKWNSVPNLEVINQPIETEEEVSFWKSHPYLNADPNKKFPMPKLKPLIPKQSASPECHISGTGQKITQYTEFQMSSDFRDTIPTHNLGFVEKQILEEASQKEMDDVSRLRTLSYIFPQQQPTDTSEFNLRRTYDCFDDMTHYDLSECQRQKGNQPPKNVSKNKSNLCFLPVLKPLRPDEREEPRRKVKLSGRSHKERGTKVKMESRKAREKTKVDMCIKPTIKPNNVEDILKRLINFSKDYQKYFSELTTERETVPARESNVLKNVYAVPVKESPRLQYCKQFEESMESPRVSTTPMVGGVSSPINEAQLTNGDGGLNWPCKEYNGIGDELPFNVTKTGKRSHVEATGITKCNSGEFMGEEDIISKTLPGIGDSQRLTNGNLNGMVEDIKINESVEKTTKSYVSHVQTSENNMDIRTNTWTSNGFSLTGEKEPSLEEQSVKVSLKLNEEQKELTVSVLPELCDTGRDNKFEERTLLSIPNGKEASNSEVEKVVPTYASVVKAGETAFQSNSVKLRSPLRKRNKPRKRSKRSSPPEEKTEPSEPRIRVSTQRQQTPVEKDPVAKPSNIFTLLPEDIPDKTTTTNNFIPRPPPRVRSARNYRPVNKLSEVSQKSKSAASTDASAIDKSGIAGAIAKLSLQPGGLPGTEREATTSAQDDYIRRQNWEMGTMDYMGRDSFDNIWAKICETIDGKVSDGLKTGGEASKTQSEVPPSSTDNSAVSGTLVPEASKPTEAPEKIIIKEKSEIEPQSTASDMGTGQTDSDSPPRTIPEPAVDLPAKSVQALEAFGKLFVSGPIAIKSDVPEEVPQVQSESSGVVSVADAPARDHPQSGEEASTQRKKSTELSDEESKQKKGMLNKILELVGVSKPETAQSVFYDTEKPNKDQSAVKEGQSVFYDVEVDQSAEVNKKKQGSSPAPVLIPEDQKFVVSGAAQGEGSSDLRLSHSAELMRTMPDLEVVCQAPPPTPQTDEISDAIKTTPQVTEHPLQDTSNESDKKILKVQLDSIIDEAERCVQKELEKSEPKKGPKTDSQPEPSQSMALVPALEAFGKLFVSGPVCIKSEISEDTTKLAVPNPDEASKEAESLQEISKSDEGVPNVLKPIEVTPAVVTELQTTLSTTEVTNKAEDIPKTAEAPQKEQLSKIQDSSPAEVKPEEILAKETSQEVRMSSDKESVRDISIDKQLEPSESSEKAADGSEKTDSAATSLISKANEALEAFGKVFVSGPVLLKSEIPFDTDKPVTEPVQEKNEEVGISEEKVESVSIAVADAQKAEAISTAETEERKLGPEPTVPPEQQKLGPEPTVPPEQQKLGPEPDAKTVENEASPLPSAAAVEEEKSALTTDKVPHTSPDIGESHKSPEALEVFGKVFVSGPVVLKSEISEDIPRTDQVGAPEAVHLGLQEKSEEPIYCNIDEIEEIKVTSAEDRKKDKPMSSKLSEQILKAIPPTERKPFTEAAAAEEAEILSQLPSTVPQNISILTDRPITEDEPVVEEEGASSSVPPVPPRRNRSKGMDAPQPPPKKKGKNGQS